MPSYDYRCEANGQVIEVQHSMSLKLNTWGELAAMAGLDLGATAADAPVERLITGGGVVSSKALKNALPPCQLGEGCGGCGA